MAETYKILGQTLTGELALDNSTVKEVIAYEVPVNSKSAVSSIHITNSGATSQSYRLSFVPNNEVGLSVTNVPYTTGSVTETYLSTGSDNFILKSSDGVSWSAITPSPSSLQYHGPVAFGGNRFVILPAFNSSGSSISSLDGITWTMSSLPVNDQWEDIAYGNSVFVSVGSLQNEANRAIYSMDGGLTWGQTALPNTGEPWWKNWKRVAYGNGKFIATRWNGSNKYAYSIDGLTWYEGTLPISSLWTDIVFADGKWILLSYYDYDSLISYDNGNTWQSIVMPFYSQWFGITYGGDRFVALREGPSNIVAYSQNGISWSISTLPANVYQTRPTYLNNMFFIFYHSKLFKSSDAITWSQTVLPQYLGNIQGSVYNFSDTTQALQQEVPQSLNKHIAIYNKTIASGETHEVKGGITLSSGDQIRAYSNSDEIIVNIYGVEIS